MKATREGTGPSLLRSSFIHIPGIGPKTERELWASRISDWDKLDDLAHRTTALPTRHSTIKRVLSESNKALEDRDASYFAAHLPPTEHWRILSEFADETAFLDIESTGLSIYYDRITLVGVYDRFSPKVYISGANLEDVRESLRNYKILVTFNGTLFDLPFLRKNLPGLKLPPVHIDLRYLLARLGLTGGLKEIEANLDIARPVEIRGVDGYDAAVLWNRFERGDVGALQTLLRYNLADTTNMLSLLRHAYGVLASRLKGEQDGSSQTILDDFLPETTGPVDGRTDLDSWNLSRFKVSAKRGVTGGVDVRVGRDWRVSWKPEPRWHPTLHSLLLEIPNRSVTIVGIDLTGSAKRKTGLGVVGPGGTRTALMSTDDEIVQWTESTNPNLVSIDSPLSLPEGRDCTRISCPCAKYGVIRQAERILKKRGINVYPALLPSMVNLTLRGIQLAARFRADGFPVIESYPGAAQDIMGIARKKTSMADLAVGLYEFGVPIDLAKLKSLSHDELDAITSAIVGLFYLAGHFEALPEEGPGALIIPKIEPTRPAAKPTSG